MAKQQENPYRPGAGHFPPYLAGRQPELEQFKKLLNQAEITQNVVLTGLRGTGKTVLMDHEYKPTAIQHRWVWVGSDMSETAFIDEMTLCTRLLTDLAVFTSGLILSTPKRSVGFKPSETSVDKALTFEVLMKYFKSQPGLTVDRLKATLEFVWSAAHATGHKGILFAYDEAQVVQDRKDKDQFPLAILLETFQSIQRKGMRYMLLLTGLPTLFPKLVESRTYAERMFTVQEVGRLTEAACREAILKPLQGNDFTFSTDSVNTLIKVSGGYPYFIQFICREAFDHIKSHKDRHPSAAPASAPIDPIIRKLDADFFAGRWNRVPDRQRILLLTVASLEHCDQEFTINEIVEKSTKLAAEKKIAKPFRTGDVSQMLPRLIEAGLVYKNRHGKYAFAVPLFGEYIQRQF